MNNKDYLLEETYDPQSRYKDLSRFEPEFWKKKKLSEMSKEEWELLCDGCGKCCLNKLEIKGKIKFTNTRCRFLDCQSCLCQIYYHRFEKVPDCRDIDLRADSVHQAKMSLKDKETVSETGIEDYENYIIDWPDL